MTRRIVALTVVVLLSVALAGCDNSGATEAIKLDGSPRHPDVEGVVAEVSRTRLVLDGDRRYDIDDELRSFSTQTLEPVPVLQRKGQYVHVGLDGKRVVWIAAVGSVVPGDPPVVYYTGELAELDGSTATFEDGTVLTLSDGVDSPVEAGFVIAEIDPDTHEVRALRVP